MATIAANRSAPANDVINIDVGASHPYTCNTCQVAFRNSDLQKGHMRSDWHRYNLKRRVASLPPISSEVFAEKVLQARANTAAQADKAGFEKACEACQKTYYSENSYRNHIGSAKHKARLAATLSRPNGKVDDEASSMMSSTFSLGEPANTSDVDSDAEEEFNEVVESLKKTGLHDRKSPVNRPSNPHLSAAGQHKEEHLVSETSNPTTPSEATPTPTTTAAPGVSLKKCLFCNYESPTPPLNALHMERIHGMFIPEKQYLVDLEGLLASLQERVFELHECLHCGKVKANAFAVQTHMRDKGHCQIPYTTEDEQIEIGEFYDFRSTYSDEDGGSDDEDESMDEGGKAANGGAKLGAKRPSKTSGENVEAMQEDDGWETDSSASSLDSDDLHAVPAEQHYHQYERLDKHPHHSRDDPRAHHQRDGWHAHNRKPAHAVFYDDYELHLPSGKSVGHRSLNRYFRQNLHSHPSPEERAERLAIQAAEAENAMDVDSDSEEDGEGEGGRQQQVARLRDQRAHGRALVNRATRGLANGVADPNSQDLRRIVLKGKKKEFAGQRHKDVHVSKRYFKEKHQNSASWSLSI
ncbi:C2H2 type zinc-finger-domain-containing protein [Apodospora peruviana]|uniref:C2H2 type zinc-finger-domain-containing protein n=1 Tax=Apodospora peruviana TaxID=516989 RepID=A0AAE0I0K0_9PEZI|nr:C2H2 type zinc-finger-domain-containing protein [Apodospora peruviana]